MTLIYTGSRMGLQGLTGLGKVYHNLSKEF